MHKAATKHVICRGTLPADIVIVGEAPGPVENDEGLPFVGPAGGILDAILARTLEYHNMTYLITNSVMCFPDNGKGGFRQPKPQEMKCCSDRLCTLIHLCGPCGIILLGASAMASYEYWADSFTQEIPYLHVWHPSYILRNGGIKSKEFKTVVQKVNKFITTDHCYPF